MTNTTCPHCNRRLEVEEERRGRPARCPHCGRGFRVPAEDSAGDRAAEVAGAGLARGLALAGMLVSLSGLVLTVGLLAMDWSGNPIAVPREVLMAMAMVPLASIGIGFYTAAKLGGGSRLVLGSRVAGYLWLLAIIYLLTRVMK